MSYQPEWSPHQQQLIHEALMAILVKSGMVHEGSELDGPALLMELEVFVQEVLN